MSLLLKLAMEMSHLTPESSNVKGYRYDRKNRQMFVTFKGGGVYRYDDVDNNTYRSFRRSKSVGKAVNRRLKAPKLPYQKIAATKLGWEGSVDPPHNARQADRGGHSFIETRVPAPGNSFLRERIREGGKLKKKAASKLRGAFEIVPHVLDYNLLGKPSTIKWLAKVNDKVVGEVITKGKKVKISGVHPDFQGMGLGKKMYGEVMRRMPGQTVASDSMLSEGARRTWEGMKKRPGYTIETPRFGRKVKKKQRSEMEMFFVDNVLSKNVRLEPGYYESLGSQFRGSLPAKAGVEPGLRHLPDAARRADVLDKRMQAAVAALTLGGGAWALADKVKGRSEEDPEPMPKQAELSDAQKKLLVGAGALATLAGGAKLRSVLKRKQRIAREPTVGWSQALDDMSPDTIMVDKKIITPWSRHRREGVVSYVSRISLHPRKKKIPFRDDATIYVGGDRALIEFTRPVRGARGREAPMVYAGPKKKILDHKDEIYDEFQKAYGPGGHLKMSAPNIKCKTCGWSWSAKDSSAKDLFNCHKCGGEKTGAMIKEATQGSTMKPSHPLFQQVVRTGTLHNKEVEGQKKKMKKKAATDGAAVLSDPRAKEVLRQAHSNANAKDIPGQSGDTISMGLDDPRYGGGIGNLGARKAPKFTGQFNPTDAPQAFSKKGSAMSDDMMKVAAQYDAAGRFMAHGFVDEFNKLAYNLEKEAELNPQQKLRQGALKRGLMPDSAPFSNPNPLKRIGKQFAAGGAVGVAAGRAVPLKRNLPVPRDAGVIPRAR